MSKPMIDNVWCQWHSSKQCDIFHSLVQILVFQPSIRVGLRKDVSHDVSAAHVLTLSTIHYLITEVKSVLPCEPWTRSANSRLPYGCQFRSTVQSDGHANNSRALENDLRAANDHSAQLQQRCDENQQPGEHD